MALHRTMWAEWKAAWYSGRIGCDFERSEEGSFTWRAYVENHNRVLGPLRGRTLGDTLGEKRVFSEFVEYSVE